MVVVVVKERRDGSVHHALIGGISGGISSAKDTLRRKREQQCKHRSRHEDSGESKLKRHGSTQRAPAKGIPMNGAEGCRGLSLAKIVLQVVRRFTTSGFAWPVSGDRLSLRSFENLYQGL